MLRNQPGIHSIKVALLAERATIEFDPLQWTLEKLADEISDIGFDATPLPPASIDTVVLKIYGMVCSACTSTIEKALLAVPGVETAEVTYATGKGRVTFDRSLVGARNLVEKVEECGYDCMLSAEDSDATQSRSLSRTKEITEWRDRLKRAVSFAIPVFFVSMLAPMIPFLRPIVRFQIIPGHLWLGDVISLGLTIPVQFWLGAKFYRNAWKAVKHGSATMDVLVVLGTTAAFLYSVGSMVVTLCFGVPISLTLTEADMYTDGDHSLDGMHTSMADGPSVFFDTSTMLITSVSLARYLENMAKGKTSAALTDLLALAPSMAIMYTTPPTYDNEKGQLGSVSKEKAVASSTQTKTKTEPATGAPTTKKIPTELVQAGDILLIQPGAQIPADGTVIQGSSSINESAITGEPIPVLKSPGDAVIGGTVNGTGVFDMVVTQAGKDTALSQIVKLVEDAQTQKAPIQALADRVAGFFVPVVISLSVATFFGWLILSTMISDERLPALFKLHGQTKLEVSL
jgi:Cu+-exporting ATPase